ncbi:MAG: hypothetical protein ACJ71O_12855 [Nitrososphaeraceae archaeon]|jgi:hypothetical protein
MNAKSILGVIVGITFVTTWWSNKTGNHDVIFKASTHAGKTFRDKINLSNSSNAESVSAEIATSGNNVYVSWWERGQNGTSNEPVLSGR